MCNILHALFLSINSPINHEEHEELAFELALYGIDTGVQYCDIDITHNICQICGKILAFVSEAKIRKNIYHYK